MAQPSQNDTSINPNPNPPQPPVSAAAPPPAVADAGRATLKRPREEDNSAEASGEALPPQKKRVKVEQDVLYRLVVPSKQIGKVIGKVGHRISKIREETKAAIKIADAVSRYEERVIIISSKDSDDTFCDAENALHQIASLILQDDGSNVEVLTAGTEHVAANTIRLLIAGCQAGGLIGVSGQNIEQLRNSSGATITVLAQNQLPLCASAHESDRVVQISGEVPAVLRGVMEIGCQLRDNPPKQVISISPTYNLSYNRPAHQYVDPSSAEYVNLTMLVPESFVGGLIGRSGGNISRIRIESGATIKVHGGKGAQKQRQIQLGGNAQQVALAKQRIDEYIYSQMMLQGGGQQLQQSIPDMSTLYQGSTILPGSTAHLQGYAPSHGLYATSAHGAGLMTAYPPVYPPTATNQAPPYYGQPYHAPTM